MKKPMVTIIAPLLMLLPLGAQAQQYTLCVGEYEKECPSHDIFRGCGGDYQRIARDFCIGEHQVFQISQEGGNHCGYHWYKINCDQFISRHTMCAADKEDDCTDPHTVFYINGSTTIEKVARQLCGVRNGDSVRVTDYKFNLMRDTPGGKHGIQTYDVICQY